MGAILVTIAVDVNGDGKVNIRDMYSIAVAFVSCDPNCDINGDGKVNMFDAFIAAQNFGQSWEK